MKTIVLSGINIFSGGTLTIYQNCLSQIVQDKLYEEYEIIAFVYKKDLYQDYGDKITYVELPKSRENYLMKLYYEYIYYYFFSIKHDVEYWFSINDVTPNVKAKKQFVYCHNPTPFYNFNKKEISLDKKMKLFSMFYKYLYQLNIKKNDYVIVQQHWIKEKFEEFYNIDSVLVAHPDVPLLKKNNSSEIKNENRNSLFIYPSYPRVFKNFEVICRAAQQLEDKGILNFQVILTIDGSENKYSKYIVEKYQHLKTIQFSGLLDKNTLYSKYNISDYLIFPSKLETWGLPITEYKSFEKPMLLANLDYAKETLNNYKKVKFFEPDDYSELANLMERIIEKSLVWESHTFDKKPDFSSWETLLSFIFK